ncbi:LPXTG cell wall anchor domain-containing protein [Staphylococcus warneri]|uniref:LPXTG cell wall anchor domain-containing protein n=1 Tax=Staphylococcus warneri TaxID=1292 RepID=UPI0038CD3ED1
MKTTKTLGATTLAGALLFTGVGATHSNEAHADSEKEKYVLPTPQEWQQRHDEMLQARLAHPNQGGEGGGPGSINSYQKSYKEYIDTSLKANEGNESLEFVVPEEGKAYLNGQNNDNSNNQQYSQNNDQQAQGQATDNNVTNQNNSQQGQAQATDNNTTAQNNTQEQSQAKALPETGKESSNTTLVTMIASVLLAAGSLLTFKRFSKEK